MSNILYIENDPDNMLVVKRALKARRYSFVGAATGRQGLELAELISPDLILLDINLPDVDGYEVVRRLRANHKHRLFRVPVIAITANGLPGAAMNALAAGCDGYMLKPIGLHELWDQVEVALGKYAHLPEFSEALVY